jgi:hypothetical protein
MTETSTRIQCANCGAETFVSPREVQSALDQLFALLSKLEGLGTSGIAAMDNELVSVRLAMVEVLEQLRSNGPRIGSNTQRMLSVTPLQNEWLEQATEALGRRLMGAIGNPTIVQGVRGRTITLAEGDYQALVWALDALRNRRFEEAKDLSAFVQMLDVEPPPLSDPDMPF